MDTGSQYRYKEQSIDNEIENMNEDKTFYSIDRFADIEVLRYKVPGFNRLELNQKLLIYHLTLAAECGRDILFDQNNKYNLFIRECLESIYLNYSGNRDCKEFKDFEEYLKCIWFANGIHHHYSTQKFIPKFSKDYFSKLLKDIKYKGDKKLIEKIIFDKDFMAKRVNLEDGADLIATSANNYYDGVTQKEAEDFYNNMADSTDQTPISYGLNSRLVKKNNQIKEVVWKVGGEYSKQIEKIISHLTEASIYAENQQQKDVIESLIEFYTTGDLEKFDEYSIKWVSDTVSSVDFVNGFIETYGDPLGMKASWESIVNFKNETATERTNTISTNAQWFEDNSPTDKRFKKETVKGVSAKVITVAMLGGDCYPATPIGINLPNANWIRQVHGSKSVTIENIMEAYSKAAQGNGFTEEFYNNDEDIKLWYQYGFETDVLHTDLHECLGHGSGKLLPGVSQDALKAYGATLEEARADLFALYYMADEKMQELGLLPDKDAYKAAYYKQILNGLMTQLVRIPLGENVEESHMRNRQLIAAWVFEKGNAEGAIEWQINNNKHYLVINDYTKIRNLFGKLLAEIQRIKSEGDYEAGRTLVEKYGVVPNKLLHEEVLNRYKSLNIAPYKGFVNPVYIPIKDEAGNIIDIVPTYKESYTDQMLRYSGKR